MFFYQHFAIFMIQLLLNEMAEVLYQTFNMKIKEQLFNQLRDLIKEVRFLKPMLSN